MLSHSVVSDSLQPHGPQRTCLWEFSRQEYWSGLPCPLLGDLPIPGIEPRSPTLQVDSLPSEIPGKPKNTEVGSLSLLQGNFPTQELNQGLLYGRRTLYQLSYSGKDCKKRNVWMGIFNCFILVTLNWGWLQTSLVAQTVKRLSTMRETWVRSLGREVPWRRKRQPTPVFLPRKSHGRRSLLAMGLQRVGHDWATSLSLSL